MKKFIASLAVVAMLINITMPTYAATLEDKKAELEDVQKQLQTKETERENKKKEVKSAIDQLMEAQAELADAQKKLTEIENNLAKLEADIKKNKLTIELKTKELLATKNIYSKRLRSIYEDGQINYLDVLLGAKDFSDFSSRMYLLQRIISRDTQLLDKIENQKTALERQREDLEANQKQLALVKENVVAQKKVVEEKAAARRAVYDQALAEQNKLDEEYNKLLEDSNNITAMIKNWESGGQINPASAHGSGRFIWPCYGEITSYYGWRTHPIFGTQRYHSGMDIAVDYGTSVCAADSGTVIYAGWMGGYGNAVMIDHGGGLVTLYGHNSSLNVDVGQSVAQGQVIALAGSTGYSTGPHCHFEVRVHGDVTDPLAYLP